MNQHGENNRATINRVSITDTIVNHLREQIQSGEYPTGEKLPTEAALCRIFGVSRTSIREATRVLQATGYVTILPGKGAFVCEEKPAQSPADNWYDVDNVRFNDFMEVRLAIETLAIRLSVERATPAQIKELEQIHEAFVGANEERDGLQLIMLDEQFHTKIIEFTKNPLLININKQLVDSFRAYRSSSFMDHRVYQNAVTPHSRILLCFQIHDVEQAIAEMHRHLEITTQDMEIIHNDWKNKQNEESEPS